MNGVWDEGHGYLVSAPRAPLSQAHIVPTHSGPWARWAWTITGALFHRMNETTRKSDRVHDTKEQARDAAIAWVQGERMREEARTG